MSFVYPGISPIGIVVAAVIQFAIGFFWYSPMTAVGRRWMQEAHPEGLPARAGGEMAIFPVGSIMAAWAVAMVIGWAHASGPVQEIGRAHV